MAKYLFFDLDGTLVNQKNEVPQSAWQAIEETRKQGNKCFICSGRNLPSTQSFVCPEMDGIIYSSGSGIMVNDEIIYENIMDQTKLKALIELLDSYDCGYTLFHRIDGFSNHHQIEAFRNYAEVLHVTFEEVLKIYSIIDIKHWTNEGVLKVDATIPREHLDAFQEKLDPYFEWIGLGVDDSSLGRIYSEITIQGTSKGDAVKRVMEHFGAPIENAYGFGDSMNDYSMLEACGTSIAMGNGLEKVKQLADYVTDDVDHDGIAKAMKHFHLYE